MISQAAAKQMFEALIEASSLFDNYPELYEMIGTYEVIQNAIDVGFNEISHDSL